MSTSTIHPTASRSSTLVHRTRRNSPPVAHYSRNTCPVEGCRLEMYNSATLKLHLEAFHSTSASPSSTSAHPGPSIEQFKCPLTTCPETFAKANQVTRHKWEHIPEELRPRCAGVRHGRSCDFKYSGRSDIMKSHWKTFHADQGDYVAPTIEPFDQILTRAQHFQLGTTLPPPSLSSSSFEFVSTPACPLPLIQSPPIHTAAPSFMPTFYPEGGEAPWHFNEQLAGVPISNEALAYDSQYMMLVPSDPYDMYDIQSVAWPSDNLTIDPRLLSLK